MFARAVVWRYAAIGFLYSFHLSTIAMVTISFAPHLVAMANFLPPERVRPIEWLRQAALARRPRATSQT